jgi:hypothetical protein
MTHIGATEMYRYNETTNRIVNGAAYFVKVVATNVAGHSATWYQPIGRDSV